MQELILGLGSNLGDRRRNIETAIDLIREKIGRIAAVSTFIETDPQGFISENKFLNGAVIVEYEPDSAGTAGGGPGAVMEILQSIESSFGRVRTGEYADRRIDLDILFYGDEIVMKPGLVIPHPKLQDRDFVLKPLMELCPDRVHPLFGKSIREMYRERYEGGGLIV
jgi:2-amino-4-hydroxy-6-hydroxymethyldihydropteridine diphosphokinase